MNKLYHFELGFPITFKYPITKKSLTWGVHAEQQRKEDRYGVIDKIHYLNTEDYFPVEVEFNHETNTIEKMLLRSKKAFGTNNICIVVIPKGGEWFVKTVWYNKVTDGHLTLDRSKYSVPIFKNTIDKLNKV